MSAKNTTANKDLVVGLGKTGLSIARSLERNEADAIFFDSRSEPPGLAELQALFPDAEVRLGGDALPRGVTRIIASPGVADSHPLMKKALKKKVDIVSDIELFARDAERPFVAVTGSNGKSTVTTLLYHMCRAAGKNVLAGGNLGEPALDLLEEDAPDLYVLELSSFQLHRTLDLPAEVAVLLNVSIDHLDWHASEAEYRESKYRVFNEAEAAVVNREDEQAAQRAERCGRVVSFGLDEPGWVRLQVYDGLGHRVDLLIDREMAAGWHRVSWSPATHLPSGLYQVRLTVNGRSVSRAIAYQK